MSRHLWFGLGVVAAIGIAVGLWLRWTTAGHPLLIGLIGLTPVLIVPLAVLGLSAWRIRSPSLGLALIALTGCYGATVVSPSAVLGCGPERAEDQIVVHTHNVYQGAADPDQVAAAIEAAEADIISFQELVPSFVADLAADPRLDRYRYRTTDSMGVVDGLGIWSRHPIAEEAVAPIRFPPMIEAAIDHPGGRLRVGAVHTSAPIDEHGISRWAAELGWLATVPTDGATVLAGDFNATMDHRQFRALLDAGWLDAHQPKGCGFDATWPDSSIGVPVLRLDHVLVSDGLEVLAVEVGPSAGSDHRSVTATLRPVPPDRLVSPDRPVPPDRPVSPDQG